VRERQNDGDYSRKTDDTGDADQNANPASTAPSLRDQHRRVVTTSSGGLRLGNCVRQRGESSDFELHERLIPHFPPGSGGRTRDRAVRNGVSPLRTGLLLRPRCWGRQGLRLEGREQAARRLGFLWTDDRGDRSRGWRQRHCRRTRRDRLVARNRIGLFRRWHWAAEHGLRVGALRHCHSSSNPSVEAGFARPEDGSGAERVTGWLRAGDDATGTRAELDADGCGKTVGTVVERGAAGATFGTTLEDGGPSGALVRGATVIGSIAALAIGAVAGRAGPIDVNRTIATKTVTLAMNPAIATDDRTITFRRRSRRISAEAPLSQRSSRTECAVPVSLINARDTFARIST
jgi:hypothetical protein